MKVDRGVAAVGTCSGHNEYGAMSAEEKGRYSSCHTPEAVPDADPNGGGG